MKGKLLTTQESLTAEDYKNSLPKARNGTAWTIET